MAAINALGDDAPPGRYDEILNELFSALSARGYSITSKLAKKLGRLLFLRSLLAEECDPETAFLLAFSD